jgi:putative FmdB family regulatory protein
METRSRAPRSLKRSAAARDRSSASSTFGGINAMPLFEYVCRACDHEFEDLAWSAESVHRPPCPKCASKKVERKLSLFAARQSTVRPSVAPGGGCSRCGDPDGPCTLD